MAVDTLTTQTSIHGREFGLDVAGRGVLNLANGTQERVVSQNPVTGALNSPELQAMVSGAGKRAQGLKMLLVGDSYAQRSNVGTGISSANVSNGIMTITTSSSHGMGVGMSGSVAGANLAAARVFNTPVISRIDGTNFTVAAPGCPDGAVAVSSAARSGMTWIKTNQHAEDGIWVHLQRRSNSAFTMYRNSAQPGYTVTEIVALWDELVTQHLSAIDHILFQAGYNSFAQGETTAQIVGGYSTAITKVGGSVPMTILAPAPIVAGSSADSAAKLEVQLQVYWQLKALCEASPNVIFVDSFSPYVNPASGAGGGYALSNYIGTDSIHPAARYSDAVAAQILPRIDASKRPGRTCITSPLDSVATTASNPNIGRNGLGLTLTGGATGPFTMGVPGDEATGVAPATPLANWTFAQNAGLPTAQLFYKPAAAGNAQCARITAVAAANQARCSFLLTTADITLGGTLELQFAFKLRTDFNASNKTPIGQNVRGLVIQLVLVYADTNSYTQQISNQQGNPSAPIYLGADLDCVMWAPPFVVPNASALTSARIDFTTVFDGAGVAQIEVSQISVRKT